MMAPSNPPQSYPFPTLPCAAPLPTLPRLAIQLQPNSRTQSKSLRQRSASLPALPPLSGYIGDNFVSNDHFMRLLWTMDWTYLINLAYTYFAGGVMTSTPNTRSRRLSNSSQQVCFKKHPQEMCRCHHPVGCFCLCSQRLSVPK